MENRVFIFKLLLVDQTSTPSGLPTSPLPSELVSQIPEHHVPEEGDGVWYCSGFPWQGSGSSYEGVIIIVRSKCEFGGRQQ